MKSFTFIFIFLNLLICDCQNLRNLLLTMDPKKLEALIAIANKTLFQLFGVTVNLDGRGFGVIDNDNAKIEIALYDDQEIPIETSKFNFEINNWIPKIPEIKADETKINIFGNNYDVKEEYKIIANLFANSIQHGSVITYIKDGDNIVANTRFKCLVNTTDGNGSFEIAIQDKNDKSKILESIKSFIKGLAKYDEEIKKVLGLLARASTVFLGIKKDWFLSSSFLNFPNLALLLIFGLL